MADTSSIEWTEATLNPWTGCTKVSPGCAHCYIDRTVPFRTTGRRFEGGHIPLVFHMDRLERMVRRRKPTLYFVNSLSDLFHEDAADDDVAKVFAAMAAAPQHTFQVLTKRPERMRELLATRRFWATVADVVLLAGRELPWGQTLFAEPVRLPNVWLGVTIENRRFVYRADLLRETPAAVRFISAEPLLGPVIGDLTGVGWPGAEHHWTDDYYGPGLDLTDIDWLIAGGESGKGFRRFDPEWALALRDGCAASGTAFFMKQMGGNRPGNALEDLPAELRVREFPARAREAIAA